MARRDPRSKGKNKWIGDSKIKGFKRRQKSGFPNEAAAQQWEQERRLRLLNPEQALILSKISKAGLEYLKDTRRRKMSKNTISSKANILTQFIWFVGPDLLLKEIRPFHIRHFLNNKYDTLANDQMEWQKEQSRLEQDPGATPKKEYKKIPVDPGKCCNRYKRELRTFFNYYKHDQVIQINPADAVNDFDEIEFEKYVPPGEDIEAIKKVSTQDELDLIRTLIHTGARAGEIRNMQYTDFNETVNKLTLWTTKRQGSKKVSHIMEVGKELKKIFIRRIKNNKKNYPWIFPSSVGEQMPKDSLDNLMPRLCKRVIKKLKKQGVKDIKFKEFTMHSIRHYMAVQIFLREGLAKTQVFLRHKRATTTDIYIKSILNIESISAPITDDIEKSMNSSSIQSQIVPLFKGKNM